MTRPSGPSPAYDDERRPPASLEAEQAVLGCLLNDHTRMPLVSDLVDARSFYHHEHRAIFAAIDRLLRQKLPVDIVTVQAELQRVDQDEDAGGLAYLNELAASVPGGFNARRYAEIVSGLAAERALIAAANDALRLSWDTTAPLADRLGRIGAELKRVEALGQGCGTRIPLLTMRELMDTAKALRWSVKHVIPANAMGMLFGGSGTFKSFIALDYALHVAYGLPWMGRKTTQGTVIYVAAEGQAGLAWRVKAWHRQRNMPVPDDMPLRVLPLALDLREDAWRVSERVQMDALTPSVVIIDTLSQTFAGEENSASDMAAYLREIGLRFRALWECTVLLVHHTGHAETERPRGSSAIKSNIDFLIGCFRDEKEMLATVTSMKAKDGELFADASFSMSVVDVGFDDDNDKLTSLVARHLSSAEEVEQARLHEQAQGRGGRDFALLNLVQNGMSSRDLQRAFYEILDGLDTEAKRKAYFRARKRAMAAGYIDIAEGVVIDRRKGA